MSLTAARLVVGVTGHRKLAGWGRLAARIDAALDQIVSPRPDDGASRTTSGSRSTSSRTASSAKGLPEEPSIGKTALRFVVLSPLAEGADRLVAERVLAREGAELEAILPMSEADYERDFATDASRSEFRSFLAKAAAIHRLPASSNRAEAYAAAGRFVVDHCDILIAIWDGKAGDGPGGTADTIAYAQSLARPIHLIKP